MVNFYISAGNTKHLGKQKVPNRTPKCEELLALCYLNENMKIGLTEIPMYVVISIDFLLYFNIFLNFGGKRFPLDCEGPAFPPGEIPQGL